MGLWVKGTRCDGLRVGFQRWACDEFVEWSVEAGDLTLIEGVFGELLREADEDGFPLLDTAVTEFADGEHEAGEGGEIVALFGGEFEEADAFGLVSAGPGQAEDPADRCGL